MSRSSSWPGLRRVWLTSLWAIASLQLAFGLAGLVASAAGIEWEREPGIPDWQRAIAILASSSLAAYLLLGARRDQRVEHMGAAFLLVGVFFANPPIRELAHLLRSTAEAVAA